MANEFNVTYTAGLGLSALYAIVHNSSGQVWNTNIINFEEWNVESDNNLHYKQDDPNLISENGSGGSGMYVGDIDSTFKTSSNALTGKYIVKIYDGSNPSVGDTFLGSDNLYWFRPTIGDGYEIQQTEYDLTQITNLNQTGVATNLKDALIQMWRRFFKKVVKDSDSIDTYNDADGVATTQTYTSSSSVDTINNAS